MFKRLSRLVLAASLLASMLVATVGIGSAAASTSCGHATGGIGWNASWYDNSSGYSGPTGAWNEVPYACWNGSTAYAEYGAPGYSGGTGNLMTFYSRGYTNGIIGRGQDGHATFYVEKYLHISCNGNSGYFYATETITVSRTGVFTEYVSGSLDLNIQLFCAPAGEGTWIT